MKKILLLLLLATFGMQAQTLQNPTYGNVKLKNNIQSTTATKVNVQETDGTINTISKYDLVNVVEVNDVPSLPLVGEVGKIYVVKNLNKIYRWNGAFYHELAGSDLNYQSIIDALTFTPENVANKSTTLTASSTLYPNNDAVIAGLATKEDKVNKVTSIGLSANDTNYPSELAVKTYADNLVVGMLNDRGTWDASVNAFPTTGGSGVGGAIRKGDMWYISVAGTLGTKSVNVGDSFRALVNAPSQVAENWSILEANIGYVPANDSNVVHLTGAETITGVKSFSPSISAVTGSAKGTIINPTLTATANNDVLVGLDVAPTFNNGGFTGVKNISARFNGVSDVRAVSMGSKFSFGDGSLYFGWNNGNYLDIISPSGLRVGTQPSIKMQLHNTTGSLLLQNGGTFTDDGINRLQVSGTISSGTTTLGNTPPTANNQLTRKDYVDTGLALKANLASPTFTGAVTAASFINSTAPATNVLLAGGDDLAQNTAFNKNFGTTAGTVVEGNYPPAKDGTGATGTWGINISGNAASATSWEAYNGSNVVNNLVYGMGYDSGSNKWTYVTLPQFRSWLDLGSNAYTSTSYQPLDSFIYSYKGNVANSTNADDLSANGIWANTTGNGTGNSNFPTAYSMLSVLGNNEAYGQVQHDYNNDGEQNVRVRFGKAFSAWRKVWDNGNFNPANYLPLSGGILSGAISGTSATFLETVSAAPATLSNHVVVKSQLDAVKPYKIYTALVTQSGTDAPTAIVLENTFGGAIVWSYVAIGQYNATLNGAFTNNKTAIRPFETSSTVGSGRSTHLSDSIIRFSTVGASGVNVNSILTSKLIEIRVYN